MSQQIVGITRRGFAQLLMGGGAALALPAGAWAQGRKSVLVIGLDISDTVTFDLAKQNNYSPPLTLQAAYDTLVTMTPGQYETVQPALATSWARTPDGKGWRFTLRPDAKFANGLRRHHRQHAGRPGGAPGELPADWRSRLDRGDCKGDRLQAGPRPRPHVAAAGRVPQRVRARESDAVASYRAGRQPAVRMGRQIAGSTVGIIGYGSIGRRLARLLLAMDARVLVSDPYAEVTDGPEPASLAELLAEADFVVCLAIATLETANLLNAETLAAMKPGAFLINASRGELLDEAALAAALDRGHLAGAALDVGLAPDQMPNPTLAARYDVIATPHVGGLTNEAAEHQAMETVGQTAAVLRGEAPPGAVNADKATRLRRSRDGSVHQRQ